MLLMLLLMLFLPLLPFLLLLPCLLLLPFLPLLPFECGPRTKPECGTKPFVTGIVHN
jgi:hypothetical protein